MSRARKPTKARVVYIVVDKYVRYESCAPTRKEAVEKHDVIFPWAPFTNEICCVPGFPNRATVVMFTEVLPRAKARRAVRRG